MLLTPYRVGVCDAVYLFVGVARRRSAAGGSLLRERSRDGFQQPFFSCGVQAPCSGSAGRRRQIFSLTAIRSALTVWNRWNSSTSRWALRKAAGVEKL